MGVNPRYCPATGGKNCYSVECTDSHCAKGGGKFVDQGVVGNELPELGVAAHNLGLTTVGTFVELVPTGATQVY